MDNAKGHLLIIGPGQPTLAQRLEEAGYETTLAAEGPWTPARLRADPPDVLLLDLQTPDLDAAGFLTGLRASEDLQDIPVIILAPATDLARVEQCLAAGAEDYLLAPISATLLKTQVRDYLEIAHSRRAARDRARQEELLKIEHDLQVARLIQVGFLPTNLPQPDGWEIAARFEPAREVAGDFYDAFTVSQGRRVGFLIADVVDKGVPAALFMALVRSLIRAFAQQNYALSWTNILEEGKESDLTPGDLAIGRGRGRTAPTTGTNALKNAVQLTNSYIVENHGDMNMFATMFFGMLDPLTGQVAYINAGHTQPLIVGADGVVKASLQGTGPAVGMFPGANFRIDYAQIDPGDVLYTYTDGVTEARDVARGFYGVKRLKAVLGEPVGSASGLLDRVEGSLSEFMAGAVQFDDITMMALRRAPQPQSTAP